MAEMRAVTTVGEEVLTGEGVDSGDEASMIASQI